MSYRAQLKFRLFQGAALIIPRTPRWLAHPIAVGAATLVWALAGGKRRHVEANLRHVPTLAGDPQRLRWAARGVFIHSALNYLDFFQGQTYTIAELVARWPDDAIEGFDQIATSLAQGRGLIVFSAHLGDFEAAVSRLGAAGYRALIPAEHLSPEQLFQLACTLRRHHNVRLLAADSRETLREMLAALRRNEIILLGFDRYIHGESARFPFFGAPARLPTASVIFALRHGSPVMFMNSWRVNWRQSRGVCTPLDLTTADQRAAVGVAPGRLNRVSDTAGEPINPRPMSGAVIATQANSSPTSQLNPHSEPRIERAMRIVISALERQIADHPEQWVSALSHIWDDDPSPSKG
ncbi:MAG TPA: lysophospholipid acyltransferase family protein [Ktedonobacterales bacterium]|nr:lysophospholipid acyltransferase family protein [Ktedonobacterales bacterium]